MNSFFEALAFVVLLFGFVGCTALTVGDPDILDAWRCDSLGISMAECRSPR